jgi:hypothetical protein
MTTTELEIVGVLENESEEEAGELGIVLPSRGATVRKCDNRGMPPIEPIQALGSVTCTPQSAHNVTDPISALRKARVRALQMLDNTIGQLSTARKAVCELGEKPADRLSANARCWLRNGMGVNTDDIHVWTAGTFEPIRSVAEVIRRLVRVRNLIGSRGLRYSCTGVHCAGHPGRWAYMTDRDSAGNCLPGTPLMLIRLCRRFWIPGTLPDGTPVPANVHTEFQAQTVIHEASHLTHSTGDLRGQTIGVAECLAQFVAATNDSPLDPRFLRLCSGTEPCRQGPGGARVFHEHKPEVEWGDEYSGGPYKWPQWPTSRHFNPSLQTVPLSPSGPVKTYSPCQAVLDDLVKLTLATDELEKQLRQKPPNSKLIKSRSEVVVALSNEMVSKLKKHNYIRQHCSQEDLRHLAVAVTAASNRGLNSAARTSLRNLLDWTHVAGKRFPGI